MTRAEVLRYWLVYNEFEITSEDLVDDGGFLYSVLTARFGGETKLNDAELYTGSYKMLGKHPLFPVFLEQQIRRFDKMLLGMDSAAIVDHSGRTESLYEVLIQLKEMREHENT